MGIIDGAIQRKGTRSHTIVEAHPAVLKRMEDGGELFLAATKYPNVLKICASKRTIVVYLGWEKKCVVVKGRWQDVIDQLGQYDAIFFDTSVQFRRTVPFHCIPCPPF